ncbi:MAG: arginine deiminase-related protein [Gammaproteobacteria bacterium]
MLERQSTAEVLMIRPVRFVGNPQTSASNKFQRRVAISDEDAQRLAQAEFDGLVEALMDAGVRVHVFEDTVEPHTPDSLFPNNWVSFHADGTVVLYPMLAPNRRAERRMDVLETLSARHGFRITRVVDLTPYERSGKYLEGTGSMVLDRSGRIAYACLSPRTDLDVLRDFAQQLDYEIVAFEAFDAGGFPIYHTNVLMCIGTRFAAVCSSAIRPDQRDGVLESLLASGRTIVDLTFDQLDGFAGNMLELHTAQGQPIIAMSSRARDSLSLTQVAALEQGQGRIVTSPVPTIETLGGGSVRCMLAEIHLPSKGGNEDTARGAG